MNYWCRILAISISVASVHAAENAMGTVDAAGRETLSVIARHSKAMSTRNVDRILADFADDAIVLTNIDVCAIGRGRNEPLVGKTAIGRCLESVLKLPSFNVKGGMTKVIRRDGIGEYAYLIFEKAKAGIQGTETYVVRGGKIVFESATFRFIKPTSDVAASAP
jgi:hypothetical protein